MRYGKVGLQLGGHEQKYYISQCEEKQSIQLTITVKGDDMTSVQERKDLIDDVTRLLYNILEKFMPKVNKPKLLIPCSMCSVLHITLEQLSAGKTIYCATSSKDVQCLSPNYYGDLIPSQSGDPALITGSCSYAIK